MHRCFFSVLLWALSTSARAPAGVPACAQSAISSGIRGSGCAADDFSCICASENLKFALESAEDVCNEADKEAVYDAMWEVCSDSILGPRDVDEDDDSAGEAEIHDDTPSPTVASEGTDMNTLDTPVEASTPTVASEGTGQAMLGTPVLASTPVIASEGTNQATLETPIPANTPTVATEGTDQETLGTPVPASTPTIATEGTDQATLSTPTVIVAPTTPSQ